MQSEELKGYPGPIGPLGMTGTESIRQTEKIELMDTEYVKKYGLGPHVAVDAVVATANQKVLLIRRKDNYRYALPGGFVEPLETLEDAVRRELREETGLDLHPVKVKDCKPFSGPLRDPRARIITFAHHFKLEVMSTMLPLTAADDAIKAEWVCLKEVGHNLIREMYADHREIILTFINGK